MKNNVGSPVREDDFFPRPNEVEQIWRAISSGSHILIAAPRRVGKTSIMFHLFEQPQDDYIVVYVTTESADSENEFWQKVFNALIDEEFLEKTKQYKTKAFMFLREFAGKVKRVSMEGIEFQDGKEQDFYSAFISFVKGLEIEKKLVIMIDEFPQTVENIIECEDEKSARQFLKSNRELRQDPKVSQKVVFVYTGSIGLEGVAAKLKATKYINDLNNIKVKPLKPDDAMELIAALAKGLEITVAENEAHYLLEKIEWLIPFYIQLILQEIKNICTDESTSNVTEAMIYQAIKASLEHRNHFEHWHQRLKVALETDEYKCAKEILNVASEEGVISSARIADIAAGHEREDDGKEIVHVLVYDGYINNDENPKEYRFNSPILRMWWEKNVAN